MACAASPASVIRPFDHCFSGVPVAQHPALHALRRGGGDQARQRGREAGGEGGRGGLEVRRRRCVGSVAVSTHHWWPSRPLCRIDVQLPWTVRLWETTHMCGARAGHLGEGEAAEDVQPVLALGLVAPQGAADERVDAVGADQHVVLGGGAVGEVQRDRAVVLLDAVDLLVEPDHAVGDGGEHPLVELGAEQPDEAAAVGLLHVLVQLDARRAPCRGRCGTPRPSVTRGPRCRRRAPGAPSPAAATG